MKSTTEDTENTDKTDLAVRDANRIAMSLYRYITLGGAARYVTCRALFGVFGVFGGSMHRGFRKAQAL